MNIDEIKEMKRYSTTYKAKAFNLLKELNSSEPVREFNGRKYQTQWRVSQMVRDRTVIDIDSHDRDNLCVVLNGYEPIMGKFYVVKTNGGYHLISKEIIDNKTRRFLNAVVLMPGIKEDEVGDYIERLDNVFNLTKTPEELNLKQLHDRASELSDRIVNAGLFTGYGRIDIPYSAISLRRDKYSVRISKKHSGDNFELIGGL